MNKQSTGIALAIGLALAMLLSIAGCATSFNRTLLVSGETLKGIGSEFVVVADVYKQGCDVTKTIKPDRCASFRKFGEEFQRDYPLAVKLWEVARVANDLSARDSVEGIIANLAAQLSAFASSVFVAQGGK